jgi:spore germination cell wall hydrolase CwlJ-like protein
VRFYKQIQKLLEALGDVPPPPPPALIQRAESKITNLDIITTTLIGEAGGEGEQGMHAVMNVIMNRTKGSSDPVRTAVSGVLKPKQFSMFNSYTLGNEDIRNIINKAKQHPRWKLAEQIALKGLSGNLADITDGATHYHVSKGKSKVAPKWTHPSFGGKNTQAVVTNTIGAHTFLKNVD